MGAVSAEVVTSTFFNFNPELVQAAIPSAWETASPAQVVAARFTAVDAAFRRLLGEEVLHTEDMQRAAELARTAADAACDRLEGRPLAAGHADVAWPDEPHLVLWHAQSILREFRGDGHVALLVVHGLSGIEALVTHAAAGEVPAGVLLSTRGWPVEDWDRAVQALWERGWLERGDTPRLPNGVPPSGKPSRMAPMPSPRRPTMLWARGVVRSSARWCGPGARSSSSRSAEPETGAGPDLVGGWA